MKINVISWIECYGWTADRTGSKAHLGGGRISKAKVERTAYGKAVTITDSLGRVRRHSGRFNMAAVAREMRARIAEQNGGAKDAAENNGHWLEVTK